MCCRSIKMQIHMVCVLFVYLKYLPQYLFYIIFIWIFATNIHRISGWDLETRDMDCIRLESTDTGNGGSECLANGLE